MGKRIARDADSKGYLLNRHENDIEPLTPAELASLNAELQDCFDEMSQLIPIVSCPGDDIEQIRKAEGRMAHLEGRRDSIERSLSLGFDERHAVPMLNHPVYNRDPDRTNNKEK